jgi:hypothetical protein
MDTAMRRMRFEITIPVFEQSKPVHVLGNPTAITEESYYCCAIIMAKSNKQAPDFDDVIFFFFVCHR